jgi:hypothetical protein
MAWVLLELRDLDFGCHFSGVGYLVSSFEFQASGLPDRVSVEPRVQELEFRVCRFGNQISGI